MPLRASMVGVDRTIARVRSPAPRSNDDVRSWVMRLLNADAEARLYDHDHGVLCTVHATRGADPVPVTYAVDDGWLGVPIDVVKPKSSTRLQRERNLDADARATLLVDHWQRDDWTRLWWVRAELRWRADRPDREAALADALATKYPQYAARPFARVLAFEVVAVSGWAGADG